MQSGPCLYVLISASPTRMAKFSHHLAIELYLGAQDTARGRSEVYRPVSDAQPAASTGINNCVVTSAAFLCHKAISLGGNPDFGEHT